MKRSQISREFSSGGGFTLLPWEDKRDVMLFLKVFVTVTVLLGMYTLSSATALLALALIFSFGIWSPGFAVAGLALLAFIVNYNFALTFPPPLFGMIKWVMFIGLCSRILLLGLVRDELKNPVTFAILAFSLVALPGVIMTELKLVSLLKLSVFTFGSLSLFAAGRILNPREKRIAGAVVLSIFVLIIVMSVMVYPFPSIKHFRALEHSYLMFGYYASVSYYQGVLQHSQQLGPICALIATMSFGLYAFSKKHGLLLLPIVASSFTLILMTKSRTALISALFGMCVVLFINYLRSSPNWQRRFRMPLFAMSKEHITGLFFSGVIASLVISVAFSAKIFSFFKSFVFKTGVSFGGGGVEDIIASRFGRVMWSMKYFDQNPIFGTGFGVSIDPTWVAANRGSLFSAPVEKAFIITGVLEEVGILGFIAFCVLCVTVVRHLFQSGNHLTLALFVTFLLINFGEMAFFSFGGIGFLYWVIVLFGQTAYDWANGR